MASHDAKRTDQDFNIAFNAVLESARSAGLDVCNEAVRSFCEQQAEKDAENHAQMRWLFNCMHSQMGVDNVEALTWEAGGEPLPDMSIRARSIAINAPREGGE